MAQEAGPQGVSGQGDAPDSRDKRRGVLPFVVLAIVILVVLLLLWLFMQRQQKVPTATGSVDAIAIVVPPPPVNPAVPAPSTLASETTTGSVVPNVVGDPESNARRALEGAGFSVSASRRYSANKPPGIVFSQTPPSGTRLDEGAVVAIAVSAGSSTVSYVTMPNVVGLTQSQAESKVKAAGLVPKLTYGNAPSQTGKVISQWPLGGTSTPAGGQGLIQIGITP